MSRFAARATGWAAISCLFVAGCWSAPTCNPSPCPPTYTATFDLHALDDSMLAWTYRNMSPPPPPTTGFVPYPPSGYDCSFQFSRGSLPPERDVSPGTITLTCATGPYSPFELKISALGDIRDWPAGSFTLVAPPGSVSVEKFFGSGCGVVNLDGLALNVTVETASGGSAPFPQLVTDDYNRVVRVDFDTASATPSCDLPVSGMLSLHLFQGHDDYVGYTNTLCGCE